jgi:hypothetical protein
MDNVGELVQRLNAAIEMLNQHAKGSDEWFNCIREAIRLDELLVAQTAPLEPAGIEARRIRFELSCNAESWSTAKQTLLENLQYFGYNAQAVKRAINHQ